MTSPLEKKILTKMLFNQHIGGRHTSIDNIPKGFAKHERGDIKKAVKNLIKAGYINPKTTSYGMEVSLDPRRVEEIRQITKNP